MEYDTGISFTNDDDLVFSNEEGELRTYNSVDKSYFKQATKKIDVMFGSDMEM